MFPSSIVVDGGNLLVQPELGQINQYFSANCSRSHRIVTDPVPCVQLRLREFISNILTHVSSPSPTANFGEIPNTRPYSSAGISILIIDFATRSAPIFSSPLYFLI